MENYIYNKIAEDETLQALLSAGSDDMYVYCNNIERGITGFDQAITFTIINTNESAPNTKSVSVQFNLFAKVHSNNVAMANALADLFNHTQNDSGDGVDIVSSFRDGEGDVPTDLDEEVYYQRQVTYKFIIR